jgi:hypothetical protein
LGSLAAVLCGCPYESPYAIDDEPQQNIDENLVGKWAAFVPKPSDDKHFKEDPVKIIFSKRTDMEYDIAITGYIEELKPYRVIVNDTIKGTAFISSIGKTQFLNATIYGKVYIAELKQTANGFSIISLSEHFTAKYIKSSKALRSAIEFHYRSRPVPIYDDWFVLKNLQKVN